MSNGYQWHQIAGTGNYGVGLHLNQWAGFIKKNPKGDKKGKEKNKKEEIQHEAKKEEIQHEAKKEEIQNETKKE